MSEETKTISPAFRMDGARAIIESAAGAIQIRQQVEAIEEAMTGRPALVFDLAKALVESISKTVLTDLGVTFDNNWDCPKLFKEALIRLQLFPDGHAAPSAVTDSLKKVANGLNTAVQGLCELRSNEGIAGHGRDGFAQTLEGVQAELAARASDAAVSFIWSAHRKYLRVPDVKRVRYEDMTDFNDWIDFAMHEEPVTIFQVSYRQSELLFKADPDGYRNAYPDYEQYLKENPE